MGQWWEVQSNKEDGKENGSFGSSNKQILRLSKPGNVSEKGGVKIPGKRRYLFEQSLREGGERMGSVTALSFQRRKKNDRVGKDGGTFCQSIGVATDIC